MFGSEVLFSVGVSQDQGKWSTPSSDSPVPHITRYATGDGAALKLQV